jgi:hypothetical protein
MAGHTDTALKTNKSINPIKKKQLKVNVPNSC